LNIRHAIKSKACQIREREKRELLLYIWEKQCIEGNIESPRILQNFGMAVPLLLIPFFLKPLLFLLSFSVDKKLDPFSHICPLSDLSFDRAPTDNLVRQVKSQVITKEELDPSLIYNESQIRFFFFFFFPLGIVVISFIRPATCRQVIGTRGFTRMW
jgi:hypothetical protein